MHMLGALEKNIGDLCNFTSAIVVLVDFTIIIKC